MIPHVALDSVILTALAAPFALLMLLAAFATVGRPLAETAVSRLTSVTMLTALSAMLLAVAVYYASGRHPHMISFGAWFSGGETQTLFDFLVDERSLIFAAVTMAICGTVAAFSNRYLHRETGFNRYFFLFAAFVLGMLLVNFAASPEVLFAGWELLGLSSALLVGFFHERRAPVVHAMHVFSVYRVSDVSMLAAVILLHHWTGSRGFTQILTSSPGMDIHLSTGQATVVALLLGIAVAGKSALLPFSGWLPRAMEGPTPSSAVYYGSLSIHAGCILLLRAAPVLEQAPIARVAIAIAGAATAGYAAFVARVQTDVKSTLSYACLSQVGLIIVEIAIGFYTLAFIHILGHSSYRLLQFLSAPNVLHELHEIEGARGLGYQAVPRHRSAVMLSTPGAIVRYLVALERGFLDTVLKRICVTPFLNLVQALDRLDRCLCRAVPAAHTTSETDRRSSDD